MGDPNDMPKADAPSAARALSATEIEEFVARDLMSKERTKPIVALTTWTGDRGFPVDPDELARQLGERAEVVAIRTGDDTWALSAALPKRMDVFGGASRIWWPGVSFDSDPHAHPLLFADSPEDADLVLRRILAAICDGDSRAGRYGPWRPGGESAPDPEPRAALPGSAPSESAATRRGSPVLDGTVLAIEGHRIRVRAGPAEGCIAYSDEKLDALASRLRPGDNVRVFATRPSADGTARFSTQGLLGPFKPPSSAARGPRWTAVRPEPVARAIVTALRGNEIEVDVDGIAGVIADADMDLAHLARDLEPGRELRVRRCGTARDGRPEFSVRGLLGDPWRRLPEVYRPGDVVRARVCRIEEKYVLVEVLPGAALIVPRPEIDWTDRRHPKHILGIGERVNVKLLAIDPLQRRGTASIKQAYTGVVKPAVSPGPGQPPFLADAKDVDPEAGAAAAERVAHLEEELGSALDDRAELMKQLRIAKDQSAELRREVRSLQDRLSAAEARFGAELDPTSSEIAFLSAVRVEYARRCDEGDRERYPLARMRVGRAFLASLRETPGISVEKVIEVCAQVASQRAHEITGREVHPLRSGEAGAPARVRRTDGAKAWRCSLQDNTASARRLHWWDIPGDKERGRTIEFASIGVHDDTDIPE